MTYCGTNSGYVMHRKRGETACEDCRGAHREYSRQARAERERRRRERLSVRCASHPGGRSPNCLVCERAAKREERLVRGLTVPPRPPEVRSPDSDYSLHAACKGMGDEFVPDNLGQGRTLNTVTRQARNVCLTCPVLRECAQDALSQDAPYGVWAAVAFTGQPYRDRHKRAALRRLLRRAS